MSKHIKWLIWLGSLVIAMVITVWLEWPDGKTHLIMCDVGQGDAFLITQGFSQMLIDTGPVKGGVLSCLGNHMPFWDKFVEVVMLTHPDSDHVGALNEVMSSYHVGEVVTTQETTNKIAPVVSKRSPIHLIWAGENIEWGKVMEEVLWPPEREVSKSDDTNRWSLVMRLTVDNDSLWMAGDADEIVEQELLKEGKVRPTTILKVAHHGSKTATIEPFLTILQPHQAWISVGKDNHYGHPDKGVLQRLQQAGIVIRRTDQQGTILVEEK